MRIEKIMDRVWYVSISWSEGDLWMVKCFVSDGVGELKRCRVYKIFKDFVLEFDDVFDGME